MWPQIVYKPGWKVTFERDPIPSRCPWERLHMDILGPLPLSDCSNCCILTIQDAFTKCASGTCLTRSEGTDISGSCDAKTDPTLWGPQTDFDGQRNQFSNFLSSFVTKLCKKLGIKYMHTSYHPSANSQVEWFNVSHITVISYTSTEAILIVVTYPTCCLHTALLCTVPHLRCLSTWRWDEIQFHPFCW